MRRSIIFITCVMASAGWSQSGERLRPLEPRRSPKSWASRRRQRPTASCGSAGRGRTLPSRSTDLQCGLFMGLGTWAAFQQNGKMSMVMGDTVCFEDEVNPAHRCGAEEWPPSHGPAQSLFLR